MAGGQGVMAADVIEHKGGSQHAHYDPDDKLGTFRVHDVEWCPDRGTTDGGRL